MTVTNTANKAVFKGNGATTVWPFTFNIPSQADIQVTLVDNTSGNETVLTPTQYSVTGFNNSAGGSVTYPLSGSPLTTATSIVIQRIMPLTQQTSFLNQGAAYPQDIESALDYLTMVCQQLNNAIGQALLFSDADSVIPTLPVASARANMVLGFNASGDPIAVSGITPGTTVSTAMIPVVTAPSTSAALTALGLPGALLDQLIPAGTIWDYALTAAPTGFVFPSGQPCTSTYPTLRAALVAAGSPFGSNGTDPLMPDLRSVVVAGKSNMNGVDNNLLTGGTVLGAVLGQQNKTLLTANLPPYTPSGSVSGTLTGISIHCRSASTTGSNDPGNLAMAATGGTDVGYLPISISSTSIAGTVAGVAQGGTSTAFSIVQPTIVLNKIMKAH